jgi:hypothetical protein
LTKNSQSITSDLEESDHVEQQVPMHDEPGEESSWRDYTESMCEAELDKDPFNMNYSFRKAELEINKG